MSKSRSRPARPTVAQEVASLRAVIDRLVDRVQVLTDSLDALTDEVQWHNNQQRDRYERPPPMVVTSLPKDPCAKDWQINQLRPEDLPEVTPSMPSQPTLFH